MAFENVYLTKEEIASFRERAIIGPNIRGMGGKKLACVSIVRCTADRERKIYLFYCGTGPYDFETPPEDHYFALVWDEITGDNCVSFRVYEKFDSERIPGKARDILWYNMSITTPKGLEDKEELFIETFKEAMCVYGLSGDPKFKVNRVVKFDF